MMSSAWSWFVIIGTVVSLVAMLWLLFANRTTGGEEKTTGHSWDGIEELDSPLPMWWVWGFVITIVFAAIYLVYYPGLGNVEGVGDWSSQGQHDAEIAAHEERFAPLYDRLGALSEAELIADRSAMQVGRRLFLNNCATCHGIGATGSFGFPDLTDEEWIWGDDFNAVKATILNGRQAVMAPWGAALGDQGVSEVAAYVRSLAGLEHDAVTAEAGKARFNVFCVACHGVDGKGNPMLGAPNLTNDLWLYGSSIEEISFTVRNGRSGYMPAFNDLLSEQQVHILAGYVRSLSK